MSAVRITAYGGAGQIGGNKILLEDGPNHIFLDFGLNFEDSGKYFAEFLAPRTSTSGTYDYLMLGLLPPLAGIYRADAAVEELDPSAWRIAKEATGYRDDVGLLGVLASHAHMDHIGLISLLSRDTAVVSSATTAVIAKSIQDTGAGGMQAEVIYGSDRQESDQVLRSVRNADLNRRPWLVTDHANWSPAAVEFWKHSPRAKGVLEAHDADPFAGNLGPLAVRSYPVDHSIPGATAYAVETSEGWVVYTGDLRTHGRRGDLTRRFVEETRELRPVALVCEATRAGSTSEKPHSEADVRARSLDIVRQEEGLVLADFGPRNVERLLNFLEVAEETDRKLVLLAKDAHLLAAMGTAQRGVPDPGSEDHLWVYKDRVGQTAAWKKRVWERFANKIVDWREVRQRQGDYIICLSFYDLPRLLDIDPPGGSYIYSTAEPYTEEQEIDIERMRTWIERFNLKFVGDPKSTSQEDQGFHSSGHASQDEVLEMVEEISPAMVIPVHTKDPARIAQALSDSKIRTEQPKTGSPINVMGS